MADGGKVGEEVTLSVRLIRSFQHRNIRHLVLKSVDLSQTTERFMILLEENVKSSSSLPPPFKKFAYDCLKIEHQAHGAKTSDPVMNRERDETLILQPGKSLMESGIKHETEIAFFKRDDYLAYKANPEFDLVGSMN